MKRKLDAVPHEEQQQRSAESKQITPAAVGIMDLPSELIYMIFALSGSLALPKVNRFLWRSLTDAPVSVKSDFLISAWGVYGKKGFLTFVAASPLCAYDVFRRIELTENTWRARYLLPCSGPGLDATKLPRRLFRSLKPLRQVHENLLGEGTKDQTASSKSDCSFRPASSYADDQLELLNLHTYPSDFFSEGNAPSDRIGAIPSPDQLKMLFALLEHHKADASSHNGYPLAMAVLNHSYALMDILLGHGADITLKDSLAAQIAIRNGDLFALKILINGPRWVTDYRPYHQAKLAKSRLWPDESHLRRAIKGKHWPIVDYLWHDCKIVPDMACLRLIEQHRR